MHLTSGTKGLNVVAMYCIVFFVALYVNAVISAIDYLLQADYNVPIEDVGKVAGTVNSVGSFCVLLTQFPMGALLDLVGRKWPITIGMLIIAGGLTGITFIHTVWPGLAIMIAVMAVSASPSESAPLMNDYIKEESYGLA